MKLVRLQGQAHRLEKLCRTSVRVVTLVPIDSDVRVIQVSALVLVGYIQGI